MNASPSKYTSNQKLTITIDGPAGAGKSSAAKLLASGLGYVYLDTGALYRAIAWKMIQEKIDLDNELKIDAFCQALEIHLTIHGDKNEVWVNKEDATPYLRFPEVTAASSVISSMRSVREKLLSVQRQLGEKGGIVAEGRDTGTVVFPNADIKFYLDADLSIRGKRRDKDLLNQGVLTELSETKRDLETRDRQDQSRSLAPLSAGKDTVIIDSTDLTLDEVLEKMMHFISERVACR